MSLLQQEQFINSFNNFAINFMKGGNEISFSPLSIYMAFVIVYLGTEGETKQELEKYFGYDDKVVIEKLSRILNTKDEGVTYEITNALFGKKGIEYQEIFKKGVEQLKSELFELQSAQQINQYVEKKTNGKIKNLITPNMVNNNTELIIVNAIYFLGEWLNKFDLAGKMPFNGKEEVEMIKSKSEKEYYIDNDITSVSIPYEGFNKKLIIIQPNNDNYNLSLDTFKKIRQARNFDEVILTMPKFKIESTLNLKEILMKEGVNGIFTKPILGISQYPLIVSDAIHKCYVDVNEKGTEAAAATGIAMCRMCLRREPPKVITIDKPFYFAIVDENNLILFCGKINNPKYE